MKHLFVSYEIAKELKEKGFNNDTFYYYDKRNQELDSEYEWSNNKDWNYALEAPLFQQAIDWFKEKHKIYVQIVYERGSWCYILYKLPSKEDLGFAASGECKDGDLWLDSDMLNTDWFYQKHDTYYKALEAAIKKAIELT